MLANLIMEAKHTVIFSGAGMSTESGIPDFRSATQGMWRHKDPAKLASTYALEHNRDEFVAFYRARIEGLQTCAPHDGHRILAEWEQRGLVHSIITQNVDGFHALAGSRYVAELHGTISRVHCQHCARVYSAVHYLEEEGTVCECGGFLRPSVVLFGESLPDDAVDMAERETYAADLFIVLGSSLQVSPANLFPQVAKRNGAKFVIVNMEPTELDYLADLVVHERKIGEVLAEANKIICTNE
ncbi:NAD-dependent deacylase [Aneurinibacillus uraniidurans]|uniref:NAD-dependent deacylase n=1 Tax=Aneurinibacillus uraniidurans TaxID=2966586 RepID=UPI00234A45C5|nr:NAD-dependent deacylase [Aneurinibacillus sp. B1]WCN36378.1 NAD-dependent deacylase [Aneurinibacillus sp. B1]